MEIVSRIIKSIVSSFFVSLVLFFITFSVLTNEFPPKISRMKIGFENFQQLLRANQELLASGNESDTNTEKNRESKLPKLGDENKALDFSNDDSLIENIQKMNRSRISIGETLFGKKVEDKPTSTATFEEIKPDILALRSEVSELKIMLKRLNQQQADIKQILIRRSTGLGNDNITR